MLIEFVAIVQAAALGCAPVVDAVSIFAESFTAELYRSLNAVLRLLSWTPP